MKLEVGMYVRTDNGIIGKIYEKIGNMFTYKDSNRDYITYDLLHSEITKASYNIIDILEVGDYVNGKKIHSLGLTIGILNTINFEDGTFTIAEDIKSIVTHEQMEQMAYKVGE